MNNEQYILSNWKHKTVKQMVEESGISEWKVREVLAKNNIDPISTKDLHASFILDHFETMTQKQISTELGITVQSVSAICLEWGIKCYKHSGKKENPPVKKSFWELVDRWDGEVIRK